MLRGVALEVDIPLLPEDHDVGPFEFALDSLIEVRPVNEYVDEFPVIAADALGSIGRRLRAGRRRGAARRQDDRKEASNEATPKQGHGQRRSSRFLQSRQSVARGNAMTRSLPIAWPQDSHTP